MGQNIVQQQRHRHVHRHKQVQTVQHSQVLDGTGHRYSRSDKDTHIDKHLHVYTQQNMYRTSLQQDIRTRTPTQTNTYTQQNRYTTSFQQYRQRHVHRQTRTRTGSRTSPQYIRLNTILKILKLENVKNELFTYEPIQKNLQPINVPLVQGNVW